MTFRSEALNVTGHEARDEHGVKLGTVTDVLFDTEGTPRWAVVDPGLLHRPHYAPLEGAYQTEEGNVVLAVDNATVKHAPLAPRDHVLTPEIEAKLVEHYS